MMILGCTKTVFKCDNMYSRKVQRCYEVYGDDENAKNKCVQQMQKAFCATVKMRR